MPRKKTNEATIAPPPVSDASVPAVKKTRKKAAVASDVVKSTKPAAPRRSAAAKTAAPKTTPETPDISMAHLAGAVESTSALTPGEVEERAYQSWIERGCPMGSPEEDWYRAERELIARFASSSK